MQAGYIFSQARTELDDPEGDFATDDYLTPFLQSAQDDLTVDVLNHANLGRMKFEVTLPAVAAGLQSLAQYFGDNQPLATLQEIVVMMEKPPSWSEAAYQQMRPLNTPAFSYNNTQPFNRVYTYTGQDVLLPGANQSLDILVYGSFKPQLIMSAETPLVLGTEAVLREGVLEKVCRTRGARATASDHQKINYALQGSLFNNWMMQQQQISVRARRFRQRGRSWDGEGDYSYSG